MTTAMSLPRTLTADITARIVIVNGLAALEWECQAFALPDAASTRLDECSANGKSALLTGANFPGPAAAAAGVGTITYTGQPIQLCVAASALFVLGGSLVAPKKCADMTIVTDEPDALEPLT